MMRRACMMLVIGCGLQVGCAVDDDGTTDDDLVAREAVVRRPAEEVSVTLTAGPGVVVMPGGSWYNRAGLAFQFDVVVTPLDQSVAASTVFLSLPTVVNVTAFSGDGWGCEAVDGGQLCRNDARRSSNAAWPTLTITARGVAYSQDTVDAYVEREEETVGHAGVLLLVDTST